MGQGFCTSCGHSFEVGDRFCTSCGTALAPVPSSPEIPSEPRRTPAPRRRARTGRWIALGAVAAVLVAAISFGLGMLAIHHGARHPQATAPPLSSSPTTPSATTTTTEPSSPAADPRALAQATALQRVVTGSAADKRAIAAAAAELARCKHLAKAIQAFVDAAQSRARLVDRANALRIGLLPGGGQAVASLSQAFRAAARADQAYVAWGHSLHKRPHGCKGKSRLRSKAIGLSSRSHTFKQQAADAWNVIARQFGLQPIAWSDL